MSEKLKPTYDVKLIQSYVRDRYFVSTALRQSSCVPYTSFYETMAWEWSRETKKTGDLIAQESGAVSPEYALVEHYAVCRRLAGRCTEPRIPTERELWDENLYSRELEDG
jgi:hypothetical protein